MVEARPLYGTVSAPWWSEVWIVGGGHSARGFDLASLRGKTVLAINESVKRLGFVGVAAAFFSLDNNWIRANYDFLEYFEEEKYLALPLETWPDLDGISNAVYLKWSHGDGLSEYPDTVCCGGNSGYAAVNVAYLKGAKKIHLIGYDLDPEVNDQHQYWSPRFKSMLCQLDRAGVSVLNHNPNSFIDAFPKTSA